MLGVSVEKTVGGFTVDFGRAKVSVYRDPWVSPRFGFERLSGDGWRWWALQVGRCFVGVSVEEPELGPDASTAAAGAAA